MGKKKPKSGGGGGQQQAGGGSGPSRSDGQRQQQQPPPPDPDSFPALGGERQQRRQVTGPPPASAFPILGEDNTQQQRQVRPQQPGQGRGQQQGPDRPQQPGQGRGQQQGQGRQPQEQPPGGWRGQPQGPPQDVGRGPRRDSGPQQQMQRGQGDRPQGPPQYMGRGQMGDSGPQYQMHRGQGDRPQGPPQQQMQREQGDRPQGPPVDAGRGPRGDSGPPQQQMQRGQGDAGKQESDAKKKDELSVTSLYEGLEDLIRAPRNLDRKGPRPGRPIRVETNHLLLDLSKMSKTAFHYDLNIEPDTPKYLMRPAVNEFIKSTWPNRHPSFDGKKNLVSACELIKPNESLTKTVQILNSDTQKNKEFKITMKLAQVVDMQALSTYVPSRDLHYTQYPQLAIQILDIILRNSPSNRMIQCGRSFFSEPRERIIPLGDGLDLWYGFYQSASLGWKPYLNIDVAHKGFPTPTTAMEAYYNTCGEHAPTFRSFMKGLKVEYVIPGQPNTFRKYKVNDIGKGAKEEQFKLDNGEKTNILEYYAKHKSYRIQNPQLPVLCVGSIQRGIKIPMELCKIAPGNVIQKKLNPNQTAAMVKAAATDTIKRKAKIMECVTSANHNQCPSIGEFNISVGRQFEEIDARILQAPDLIYQNNVQVSRGVWRASRFLKPESLNKWGIISLSNRTRPEEYQNLQDLVIKEGKNLGLNISQPTIQSQFINERDLLNFFKSLKGIQLLFVVINDPRPNEVSAYSKVKKCAELTVGLLTQCIKTRTLSRLNPATVGNILLKVNAKLNGINHTLSDRSRPKCLLRPVMIVGADVTHPSPDQTEIPSVAAVAASHDPKAFQYNILTRLQDPRQEMIQDLEAIIREQLMFFKNKTKCEPERILYFRDGVSDGQIPQVLKIELQAIRRACTSLNVNFTPMITFVIVQKRHHTRFFPPKNANYVDDKRNNNVPAGTCVDSEIVHPRETDFYLVSHASIQGTARPTKYRLAWDDSNMTEDELEQLTYYLCHLFSRCTRSVSYPTPTYYAHLAAFRARVHLEGERVNLNNLEQEQTRRSVQQSFQQGSPMFFV